MKREKSLMEIAQALWSLCGTAVATWRYRAGRNYIGTATTVHVGRDYRRSGTALKPPVELQTLIRLQRRHVFCKEKKSQARNRKSTNCECTVSEEKDNFEGARLMDEGAGVDMNGQGECRRAGMIKGGREIEYIEKPERACQRGNGSPRGRGWFVMRCNRKTR
jgi:hypothetical protein